MIATDIVTAIRRRYGCESDGIGPEWAALDELELTGPGSRRIDLLLVRAWSGKPKGHERHAVEIKVSRADLRNEIDQPDKWGAWAAHVHRFYLAVPADLDLTGIDIPDTWGIYTATTGGTRETRRATKNPHPQPLPERCHVEAFRRAARAEARIRDAANAGDLTAQLAAAQQRIVAADRGTFTARQAEDRWKGRAQQALELFARTAPAVHCHCGTTIKLHRGRNAFGRYGIRWTHTGEPGEQYGRACEYPSPDLDRLGEDLVDAEVAP